MNIGDNSEKIFQLWFGKLSRISSEEWESFKRSEKRNLYDLWHIGIRDFNGGHLSKGRFALREYPVSYWACNLVTTRNETDPNLRKKRNRTFEDGYHYQPKKPGITKHRYLKTDAILLDLRREIFPFYISLKKYRIIENPQEFIDNCISSEEKGCEEAVYPITQAIAEYAYNNCFDGIIWKSARPITDGRLASEFCVVIFNDSLLLKEPDEHWKNTEGIMSIVSNKELINSLNEYERKKTITNSQLTE